MLLVPGERERSEGLEALDHRGPLEGHQAPVLQEVEADLPPLPLHLLLPGPQQGDVLLPAPCIAHHVKVVPSLGDWIFIQDEEKENKDEDDAEDVNDDLGDGDKCDLCDNQVIDNPAGRSGEDSKGALAGNIIRRQRCALHLPGGKSSHVRHGDALHEGQPVPALHPALQHVGHVEYTAVGPGEQLQLTGHNSDRRQYTVDCTMYTG